MRTFLTIKSDGSNGPKIKAKTLEKAIELLTLLQENQNNIKYELFGEEVIIPIQ
jgi:hypothetical protein